MKKVIFGIAVALAALSASALTTTNGKFEGELVGKIDTDQWVIIVAEEQGMTWDCFYGFEPCKGTLKAGATPNMSGYYSDFEVNPFLFENAHFEYIYR